MNKKEAIQAMLDGDVIEWEGSGFVYIFSFKSFGFLRLPKDSSGRICDNPTAYNVNLLGSETAFRIYQESKRLVKFYKHINSVGETTCFFSDCGLRFAPGVMEIIKMTTNPDWIKIHGAYIEVLV